ncbi:hypothetical protein [Aliamphritea spongicola]|nr:hypothetical protein [Aliamphritea spongicola]
MFPAHQYFEALQTGVCAAHLRLEVDKNALICVQGCPQLIGEQ